MGVIRRDGCFLQGTETKESPITGKWRLLGGKLEEGETSEEAFIREVAEEAGIRVRILKKIGEREGDHRPITIDILLADHVDGRLTPNKKEIGVLRYFTRKEVAALDMDPVSRHVFEAWGEKI
jgi:8-oxo-dGTP diphosphatase